MVRVEGEGLSGSDLARDTADGAGDGRVVHSEVGTVDGGGERALENVLRVQGLGLRVEG